MASVLDSGDLGHWHHCRKARKCFGQPCRGTSPRKWHCFCVPSIWGFTLKCQESCLPLASQAIGGFSGIWRWGPWGEPGWKWTRRPCCSLELELGVGESLSHGSSLSALLTPFSCESLIFHTSFSTALPPFHLQPVQRRNLLPPSNVSLLVGIERPEECS